MIDSVRLRLPGYHPAIEHFVDRGTYRFIQDGMGMAMQMGRIRNLRITVDAFGLAIEGSIPKYMHGNNVVAVEPHHVWSFIHQMSEIVGASVEDAEVHSLEIGIVVRLEHPVGMYLELLEEMPRHKKHVFSNETVLFTQRSKSFQAYDKNKELKKHSNNESNLNGLNLIRFELKFKSKKALQEKIIERKVIKGRDLYNNHFHIACLSLLSNAYDSVVKKRNPVTLFLISQTPKELSRMLAVIGCRTIGYERLLGQLDGLRQTIPRHRSDRIKKCLRELARVDTIQDQDELMKEMDERFTSYVRETEHRIELDIDCDAIFGHDDCELETINTEAL